MNLHLKDYREVVELMQAGSADINYTLSALSQLRGSRTTNDVTFRSRIEYVIISDSYGGEFA